MAFAEVEIVLFWIAHAALGTRRFLSSVAYRRAVAFRFKL
jgi:hypothetical protein